MKTTKQNDKNLDKTQGLWIGKLKHCKDKVGGIKWTDKPTKTLGIYFGHDKEECEKLNWENKIEKMNNLLLCFMVKKKFNNLRENFDNQIFNCSYIYICG